MGPAIGKIINDNSFKVLAVDGATPSDRLKYMFEQCGKSAEERYDTIDEYVNTNDAFGQALKNHKISWPSNFDGF